MQYACLRLIVIEAGLEKYFWLKSNLNSIKMKASKIRIFYFTKVSHVHWVHKLLTWNDAPSLDTSQLISNSFPYLHSRYHVLLGYKKLLRSNKTFKFGILYLLILCNIFLKQIIDSQSTMWELFQYIAIIRDASYNFFHTWETSWAILFNVLLSLLYSVFTSYRKWFNFICFTELFQGISYHTSKFHDTH